MAEAMAVAGATGGATSVVDKMADFLGKLFDKVVEIYSDPLKGTLISIGLVKLTGLISISSDQIGADLDKVADQLDKFDPSTILGNPPSFDIEEDFKRAKGILGL